MKPRFIKEVKQFDQVVEKFDTEIISNSICSQETIDKVKNMMKNVVEKNMAQPIIFILKTFQWLEKQVHVRLNIGNRKDYIYHLLLDISQPIIRNIHV